jgi:hypothetical protein
MNEAQGVQPSARPRALRLTQAARAKIVFCTVFSSLENTVWDDFLALEATKDAPIRPLPANRLFHCDRKRRDRLENRSAIKHRPADLVSQPLILSRKFTNRIQELFALPTPLEPTSMFSLGFGPPHVLDRAGCNTKLVGGDMSCPQSQEPMIGVREWSPSTNHDEAGGAVFGQDHGCDFTDPYALDRAVLDRAVEARDCHDRCFQPWLENRANKPRTKRTGRRILTPGSVTD